MREVNFSVINSLGQTLEGFERIKNSLLIAPDPSGSHAIGFNSADQELGETRILTHAVYFAQILFPKNKITLPKVAKTMTSEVFS
jgi:hypothetical protein